jgi:hypothetical protein
VAKLSDKKINVKKEGIIGGGYSKLIPNNNKRNSTIEPVSIYVSSSTELKKNNKEKLPKIIKAKKMMGGEPFVFNRNLESYYNFVNSAFQNHKIKRDILQKIWSYYQESQERAILNNPNRNYENYIFYIYNITDNTIISTGVIGKNDFTESGRIIINSKEYLYIHYLLSRQKRNLGGTSAIYHILKRLPDKYRGICLRSTINAKSFYKGIGFIEYEDLFILNRENLDKIEAKLPHPITTEFYSTYPGNIIT